MSARKPAEKRQRGKRTRDVGHLEVVPDGTAEGYFPLPKLAGKPALVYTREAWESYWKSSLPQLLTPADAPALVRLFELLDERERMARALRREPFTTGSTGQRVVNPAAKVVASLDTRILQLEDRFGITPLARMKLGIAIGEAARSLDDLNREFDEDPDGDESAGEEEDPRIIEASSTEAS